MPPPLRISTRNARFQQWQALLGNRTKRQRAGEFLVHGVRPISLALRFDWALTALLYDADRDLSTWARDVLSTAIAGDPVRAALTTELMAELGEKDEGAPELIAVATLPPDSLRRLARGGGAPSGSTLGVVFDRPTGPGNIGTLIRSADAFGAHGVVVTGHAADPYDPRSVRASAGSLFAVPVVRVPSHREVLAWRDTMAPTDRPQLVATDERGDIDAADADLTGPTYVVIGNETSGLSAAWRDACDVTVRIPMTGSASSLNAASAATVVLYEAARQRTAAERPPTFERELG
ncbi:MAG TPA: TrmH family RNA methyltransferase [Micromonosporaceae bacterium]|nr:TrmH family RNA methyltransferase [Micromonosporaceae bacterium]